MSDKYELQGEHLIRRLMKDGVSALILRFVTAILTYGTFVVLARWMEDAEYGRMAFGFSSAMTLSLFAGRGQPQLVLRFLGEYSGTGRNSLIRDLLKCTSKVTFQGAAIAMLILVTAAIVGGLRQQGESWGYLYSAASLAGMLTLAMYQMRVLRGLGHVARALAPRDILWRPFSLLVLLIWGTTSLTATVALSVLTGVLASLLLLQFILVARPSLYVEYKESGNPTDTSPLNTESMQRTRTIWRRTGKSLWAAASLGPSLQHITVVILGITLSPAQTGPLFSALKTAATLTLPLQAVNLIVAPVIARKYSEGDISAVQKIATISALVSGALALGGCVIFMVFGKFILGLFNPEYGIAAPALTTMAAGFLISALNGSSAYLMTMTGHERPYLKILLASNILAILLITILSATLGMIGAAMGFAFGVSAWNIAVSIWARRNINLDPSIVSVLWPPRNLNDEEQRRE